MKNRWIALYVENEVGVLAKVSGLQGLLLLQHTVPCVKGVSTINLSLSKRAKREFALKHRDVGTIDWEK